MSTNLKSRLITTTVVAALTGGSVFYAFAATPATDNRAGMMQGGHGNMPMMQMMGQMSEMMDACTNMMSATAKQNRSGEQKQKQQSEEKS